MSSKQTAAKSNLCQIKKDNDEACTEQAKYRCPVCLLRYCSLPCFKHHKGSSNQCQKPAVSTDAASMQHKNDRRSENSRNLEQDAADEEEIEFRVPHEKLDKVKNSQNLKPYLTNSKLRQLIREIDSSGSGRKKRLWRQLENDRDFRIFIDKMLTEMGYFDPETN